MQQPIPGEVLTLMPGLRMVLAPNPSPMTHWGTNTFILGEGDVAVIDPGPDSAAHLAALQTATRGETVSHILVTHAHLDHSPLARRLADQTGAPIYAFGAATDGRSATMARLAAEGLAGGGEGVDTEFRPDEALADGDVVKGAGWQLSVLHTPGHFAGHLGFAMGNVLISGDHVMDWSSSLVSPPDGDLTAFMATSERLRDHGFDRLYPSHGGPIDQPQERLTWLIQHRLKREAAIREALQSTPQSVRALTARVYTDIPMPCCQPPNETSLRI